MKLLENITNEELDKMSLIEVKSQIGKRVRILMEKHGMKKRDAYNLVCDVEKLSVAAHIKKQSN